MWVELNVIVFVNLVFGVCMSCYGDFFDLVVVIIGCVLYVGLYVDVNCVVWIVFNVFDFSCLLLCDIYFVVFGLVVGKIVGVVVLVIVGLLVDIIEDEFKVLGVVVVLSGVVVLFYVVGVMFEVLMFDVVLYGCVV